MLTEEQKEKGRQSWRRSRERNLEKHLERDRERYREERRKGYNRFKEWKAKNPEEGMLISIRARCKELGHSFNLTKEDILIPTHCPILGIKLDWNDRNSKPSVDRVIPSLGYVKGNICIISMKANTLKSDGTAEQHRAIADYIDSFKPPKQEHL